MMRGLAAKIAFFGFRRPKPLFVVLSVLALLSALPFLFLNFSSDVFRMLPEGSDSLRACRALTDSGMFNKAVVLLTADDSALFERPETGTAVSKLADALEKDPDVLRVECRMTPDSWENELADLPRFLPQLVPFETIDPQKAAESSAMRLALGSPAFMTLFDPTGISLRLLERLDVFRQTSGIALRDGSAWLISPDGLHLMILLETSVSPGDPKGGARLHESLTRILKENPIPGAKPDLVLPHRHAVENERVLRADVRNVSLASLVVFTLLTLLLFRRDARTLLIPAIPCLAAFMVLALTMSLFHPPLLMIAGMGGVIVGLGVDYGIHVYAAMRSARPLRRLTHIVPPLFLGALTSAGVFLTFVGSSIPGMRQLGFFVGTSLIVSLLFALAFLPRAFSKKSDAGSGAVPFHLRPFGRKTAFFLLLFLLIGVPALLRPRPFFNDGAPGRGLRAFDMTPESFDLPAKKQAQWFQIDPERQPEFLLFSGRSQEEALASIPGEWSADAEAGVFPPTCLWPSRAERESNLASWRKSFDFERFAEELDASAEQAGFVSDAFHPFLRKLKSGLENPPSEPPGIFRPVLDRLTTVGRDGLAYAAVVVSPNAGTERLAADSGAVRISQSQLPNLLAADVFAAVRLPFILAAAIAFLLPLACFRNLGTMFLSWLPVAASAALSLSVTAPFGSPVGLPVQIGLIVLSGLALDYGVFVLSARDSDALRHASWSVTLSALTSLAGGAALLFARHPLLRETGATLILGLTAAWFVAVFLLPAFASPARGAFRQKKEIKVDKTSRKDILSEKADRIGRTCRRRRNDASSALNSSSAGGAERA